MLQIDLKLSRVQSLWYLTKALPSREEPDISLSIMNSFHLTCYARIISPKHGSTLNTHSNDFIHTYIECVTSRKRKNHFVSRCEGQEWCSW